jgi:hypothetical protein
LTNFEANVAVTKNIIFYCDDVKRIPRCLGRHVVNFTNILRAAFSYKSFAHSFFVLTLFIFWRKNIGAKAVLKMLVKLTPVQHLMQALKFENLRACMRKGLRA